MSLDKERYCQTFACRMGYTVKAIMRKLTRRFKCEKVDLTLEQYFILNILDNEEGLILQDLAEIVDRDKSAVLRHINGLEKNQFLTRAIDPKDKRRKLLILTKPGIKELAKARKLDIQVNNEVTQNIKQEKLEELEAMISKIYRSAVNENIG